MPCRQCAGCGTKKARNELVRVTAGADGRLMVDTDAVMPGRGAYLCRNASCLEKALKKNSFARILRSKISITDEIMQELRKQTAVTTGNE